MKDKIIKIIESYFDNYIGLKTAQKALEIDDLPDIAKEIEESLLWYGPDQVPPTPFFRVIGDDGRIYKYSLGWYVKGEHSKWDEWEVKPPEKWRYPEPKKIEQ